MESMVNKKSLSLPNNINGSNILVTGGTGFIGSHVVKSLLKHKAKIIVPYIEINPRSLFYLDKLSKKVNIEHVDVTNKSKVFRLIKKYNIDYIIHFAAQTVVTKAYQSPFETLKTNIMGTVNVLEAARNYKNIKGIIVASSDKAYGKTTVPYTEDFPLRGDHPYDVSKSCTDLIAQTYFKTYKLPIVVTRFGNVYGEGDLHLDRIIPSICQAIINKEILKIRSDGTYVRDYVYVKDIAEGCVLLLTKINQVLGEAFNFSSKDTDSVLEVVKKAQEIIGVDIPYTIMNNSKNEIPYQHLIDSKVRKLGWKNQYRLKDVLPKVYSWYKKNLRRSYG